MEEKPDHNWPWWRWMLTGLNIVALGLTVILAWHYLKGGSMAGCSGGSPCEEVLNSRWSTVTGNFPISGLGISAYLALLVAGLFIGPGSDAPVRRIAWSAMLILSGAIAGSAIWFTIVQKWLIGSFCPYCMTIHITGLLLSALIYWRAFTRFRHEPPNVNFQRSKAIGLAGIGLILSAGLAVFQISFTSPANLSTGQAGNNLSFIKYETAPMIGNRDATYKVTMLFDYNCPHCQKIHIMLNQVVTQYQDKLAFVLCPTPLSTQCNRYIPRDVEAFKNSCELARISLAVWKAAPEAFPVFDSWMFRDDPVKPWRPRDLAAAKAKAVELIGEAKVSAASYDSWIQEYLENCVQIYGQTARNGKGGVPKLVWGTRWVIPEPKDVNDLITILQETLTVPKP